MSAREQFYVDWKHVIKDNVPRIMGDPDYRTEVRIVGWDYHLAAVTAAREAGIREAIAAVEGMPHGDECCSRGCNGMHAENWEWQQRILPLLGLTPDDELPPEPKCDETCNCIVASFAAPIHALLPDGDR